jgi:hypothetical protein
MDGARWLREPLVHFVLIGAGLFLLYELTAEPTDAATDQIVVATATVEQLSSQFGRTWLRPPTAEELDALVANHIRDEVYYREALSLGLDQDDVLIRRRLRQKLEFILEDLSIEQTPSDEVLASYLVDNAERFRIDPRMTFTQIYLNADGRGDLNEDAVRLLDALRAGQASESAGDRTMLPAEFTDAAPYEIARWFGQDFADVLFELEPGPWQGPLRSGLGVHLVRIDSLEPGRAKTLDEARAELERDYLAERRTELEEIAYQRLLSRYKVVIEQPAADDRVEKGQPANDRQAQAPAGAVASGR